MGIGDIGGATRNYLGALDTTIQQKEARAPGQLIGALGSGMKSMYDQSKAKEDEQKVRTMLEESGFTPAEADGLVKAGPAAAGRALLDKKREALEREQQLADRGVDLAKEGFDPQGKYLGGANDPSVQRADATGKAANERMQSMETWRDDQETKRNRDIYGAATDPISDQETMAEMDVVPASGPLMRAPSPEEVAREAIRRGGDPSKASTLANALTPQGPRWKPDVPPDPAETDLKRAQAEQARAAGRKYDAEAAGAGQSNLPPSLTKEGIAAQLDLERQRAEQNAARAPAPGSLDEATQQRVLNIRQKLGFLSRKMSAKDRIGRPVLPSAEDVQAMKDLNDEMDSIVPPRGKTIGKAPGGGAPPPAAEGPPDGRPREVTTRDGKRLVWDDAAGGYVEAQ